ncbi:MAG TPA: DegT/DnrJ/EryC1/StrS family aminotransferase [Pyrinomonadaceae bacterium]|nr:DegT/DnrJ/EryC1/StrS family aminotransferase [Pyrinomonadaceae bacterium]
MSQQKSNVLDDRLALFGGSPIVDSPAPLWPFFDHTDREALDSVLETRVWGGYHEAVAELERRFAAFHDAKYGIALANGTVSLEIALTAAGIKPGDEVIVPPITFVASATAVARVGATPVFVDIDPQTIDLNPDLIEQSITERTRAIVAVHFAGHPVDLDRVVPLCDQYKLTLIEDCAHAHGASWNEQRVGSFGKFGSFSFQASKNMTAGEGGILITNDPDLAERARSISNQGRRTGGAWYEHPSLGTNARITGFQAALLLNQLERLPKQLATRMQRATYLRDKLESIHGLTPTPRTLDERLTIHAYHLFSMRYESVQWHDVPRAKVVAALLAEGVPVTLGYPHPIYRNAVFQQHPTVVRPCPEAEAYCEASIWLPHNALLASEEWLNKVVLAISKVRNAVGELATAS